jgi:hypothetical protein
MADPARHYPWNSRWPARFGSLVELAQTPYYRALFAKPFTTFILETYAFGRPDHYWINGISQAQIRDETRQFDELSAYLLSAYRGTNKTSCFSTGKATGRSGATFDRATVPTPTAIAGMIEWLNARQEASSGRGPDWRVSARRTCACTTPPR